MRITYRHMIPINGRRYINLQGSVSRLFGLHRFDANKPTLLLVEGELNAVSIWQACNDLDLTVLSFGSEGGNVDDAQRVVEIFGFEQVLF